MTDPADYLLKVDGDTLRGEGIVAGDHVVVRQQSAAEAGQLVLAAVDGAGTLKRCEAGDRVLGIVAWVMGRRA